MTHMLDDAHLLEPLGTGCRLGSHRVVEPKGALPQGAWRVDNTPRAYANEILCDVETLNVDSASFKQRKEVPGDWHNNWRAMSLVGVAGPFGGMGPLAGTARRVRLVHGEPARAEALAEGLRAAGFADVAIPDRGESVTVA